MWQEQQQRPDQATKSRRIMTNIAKLGDKMRWQNFTKIIKTCEICSGSATIDATMQYRFSDFMAY